MRIDLLITELDFGGAEQCLVRLAVFLQKEGLQVRVIALGVSPPAGRQALVEILEQEKIPFVFLGGVGVKSLPWVIRSLQKLVKQDPPDVVQAFLFHANILAAWVYGRRGIRFFTGYRVAEPRKWRYWLERWASQRMESGVCVSQDVATWCGVRLKIAAQRLVVIENGVTPSKLLDRENAMTAEAMAEWVRLKRATDVPLEAPYLLLAGRLVYQKGVDRLLQQVPHLLGELPDHHLVLMGDGMDGEIAKEYAAISETFRARVHWIGWSSSPRHWIAGSDLVLLPTRYEGMPNVLLEAMAEGRAVAVMDAEGVREAIGSEGMMQVTEQYDIDGWTELVIQFVRSAEFRRRVGDQNRKRMESQGVWEVKLRRYLALYRGRIASTGSC